MANSRTRSRPDLGRGSSRNFHWIWYQIWGSDRYDLISLAISLNTSSWVIPRARSASLRSWSRNISGPTESQRPERCQIDAGCMAGSRNSCAPISSMPWRTMFSTLSCTRSPRGSSE